MITLREAEKLPDKTPLDGVKFKLEKIFKRFDPTNKGWATKFSCSGSDASGKGLVVFSIKDLSIFNPEEHVGEVITVTAGKNKRGESCGLFTQHEGQYKKVCITDYAFINTDGSPASSSSAPARGSTQQTKSQSTESAEQMAKRLAWEWTQVYNWTNDIFTGAIGDYETSLVTGVLIEMRRNGAAFPIYPGNLAEYEYNGKKLRDMKKKELGAAAAKELVGDNPDKVIIDTAIDKLGGKKVFGYFVQEHDVSVDAIDTIALKLFTAESDDLDEKQFLTLLADKASLVRMIELSGDSGDEGEEDEDDD